MRSALFALGLVALSACSTVRNVQVRPDYEQVDRTKTLRLAVVTAPLPNGDEQLGMLWSEIARRYVNDKRDFIASVQLAAPEIPADACGENLEGLLHLAPQVRREGDGVEAEVKAELLRCSDREIIWSAEGGGSWASEDDLFSSTTASYVEKYGPGVEPYVAPTFRLLRAVLDTLPYPKIEDDEAIMEKIELVD